MPSASPTRPLLLLLRRSHRVDHFIRFSPPRARYTASAKSSSPLRSRWIRNGILFTFGAAAGAYLGFSTEKGVSGGDGDPLWSDFILEAKDPLSPTTAVFTLRSTSLPPTYYSDLWRRSIWAVDIRQPQLQIAREYTPLPPGVGPDGEPLERTETAELHLLVREEYRGEVSGYLHRLAIGSTVGISRPHCQVALPKEIRNVVFVVGGTGITTALQAIHALLDLQKAGEEKPFLHILWANRRREDCLGGISDTKAPAGRGWWGLAALFGSSSQEAEETPLGRSPLVDELRRLKETHKGHLRVDYFVDEEGSFVKAESIGNALERLPSGKTCIAISGPDGFMANLAGERRILKNSVTERPANGILAELKQRDWELMVLG